MHQQPQLGLCDYLHLTVRIMLISLDINLAAAVKMEDLTSAVGHLFHHHSIYSDLDIAQHITEDYDVKLSAH